MVRPLWSINGSVRFSRNLHGTRWHHVLCFCSDRFQFYCRRSAAFRNWHRLPVRKHDFRPALWRWYYPYATLPRPQPVTPTPNPSPTGVGSLRRPWWVASIHIPGALNRRWGAGKKVRRPALAATSRRDRGWLRGRGVRKGRAHLCYRNTTVTSGVAHLSFTPRLKHPWIVGLAR